MTPARVFLLGSLVVVVLVGVLAEHLGRRGFSPRPVPHEHEAVVAAGTAARDDAVAGYLESVATAEAVDQFLADYEGRRVAAAAKRKQQAKPKVVASTAPLRDVWHSLAMCETGGTMNQRATSPSGKYLGFFQFSLATWRAVGGPGDPRDHAYETQRSFAQKLQQRSGWGQWPTCARKLGLIGGACQRSCVSGAAFIR